MTTDVVVIIPKELMKRIKLKVNYFEKGEPVISPSDDELILAILENFADA